MKKKRLLHISSKLENSHGIKMSPFSMNCHKLGTPDISSILGEGSISSIERRKDERLLAAFCQDIRQYLPV